MFSPKVIYEVIISPLFRWPKLVCHYIQTSALLWAKFLYIRNQFKEIDMDEYKDFVELASPLDWMGQEDLTENT
ncbi:hypothetical protein, partial [Shewanella oncorhynchi]|uniref:hypothetical protein n=1 Tax=Shewanella oncorhynchi TaxID=2726434 RepID=UPI001B3A941F